MRPSQITYRKRSRLLELKFDDGNATLPAELLRVYSPSAEVRGHSPSERQLQTGKKQVQINALEPVGNYGIRISFDDGHDTGIYAWDYLRDLADNQERYWQEYLAELEAANASRLPSIPVRQFTPKPS